MHEWKKTCNEWIEGRQNIFFDILKNRLIDWFLKTILSTMVYNIVNDTVSCIKHFSPTPTSSVCKGCARALVRWIYHWLTILKLFSEIDLYLYKIHCTHNQNFIVILLSKRRLTTYSIIFTKSRKISCCFSTLFELDIIHITHMRNNLIMIFDVQRSSISSL